MRTFTRYLTLFALLIMAATGAKADPIDISSSAVVTLADSESLIYDGYPKYPILSVTYEENEVYEYEISYKRSDEAQYSSENSVNAGSYTAKIVFTSENYTGNTEVEFTITKATPNLYDAPAAMYWLVYTGEPQQLLWNLGYVDHGTLMYSTDGENYSAESPTGIEAGEYTVYYRVDGNENYNDLEAQTLTATINPANKDDLNNIINMVEEYYNDIKDSYADIAATLLTAINTAKAVAEKESPTQDEINEVQNDLNNAWIAAMSAVAVTNVINLINNIGEVELTYECKDRIEDARRAYGYLTDEQKEQVTNYSTLTQAEATYASLMGDEEAVAEVTAKIEDIGEVKYDNESSQKINAARAAYDALTDDQKALVSTETLETLSNAEATYAQLKADQAAADAALAKIWAIDIVEYTDECKDRIDKARAAYDALTEAQKALLNARTVNTLTRAEAAYAKLKADKEAADAVTALIEAIGTVEYTNDCKAKIDAARQAYGLLTDDQKALVSTETLETLTEAEAGYTSQMNVEDAVADVTAKIEAIGTVEYTADCGQKIDTAFAAFNALTDEQRGQLDVDLMNALFEAQNTYGSLKEKAENDKMAATAVINQIDDIGTVEYNWDSENFITDARNAYDALTDDQKALVTNYETLTAAESTYAQLKAEAQAAADAVTALIEAIGEVEVTAECKAKVEAAMDAYNALTDEQKNLMSEEALTTLWDAWNNFLYQYYEALWNREFVDVETPTESYSTFFSDKPMTLISSNAKLYTITGVSGNVLTLSEPLTNIPANTPVLVFNDDEYFTDVRLGELIAVAVDDVSYDKEHFFGTLVDKTFTDDDMEEADYYKLTSQNTFIWVKDAGTLPAGNCWIQIPKNSANARSLSIGGGNGTTGIHEIANSKPADDKWYDLNGRKLNGKPTKKGVYMKDGQKFVVK